jgi:hypothetical protein
MPTSPRCRDIKRPFSIPTSQILNRPTAVASFNTPFGSNLRSAPVAPGRSLVAGGAATSSRPVTPAASAHRRPRATLLAYPPRTHFVRASAALPLRSGPRTNMVQFTSPQPARVPCLLSCASAWRPLLVPMLARGARVSAKHGTLARLPRDARLAGFCFGTFRSRSSRHRERARPHRAAGDRDAAALPQVRLRDDSFRYHFTSPLQNRRDWLARPCGSHHPWRSERAQLLTLHLRFSVRAPARLGFR